MTKRAIIILCAMAGMLASVTAQAQERLFNQIGGALFGAVTNTVVGGVTSVVGHAMQGTRQEPGRVDVEAMAEQMLQGVPEEQREKLRPQLIARLAQAQAQHEGSERGEIRIEQAAQAVAVAKVTPIGNRQIFDAAERAARMRGRMDVPTGVSAGVQAVAVGAVLARIFGGSGGPAMPQEKVLEPAPVVTE